MFSPHAEARHKRTGNLHVLFREMFAYKHGEPIPKDDAFPVQPCKQKNAVRLKGVKGSGKRGLGGENPGG